jgi:hypothetical protein
LRSVFTFIENKKSLVGIFTYFAFFLLIDILRHRDRSAIDFYKLQSGGFENSEKFITNATPPIRNLMLRIPQRCMYNSFPKQKIKASVAAGIHYLLRPFQ